MMSDRSPPPEPQRAAAPVSSRPGCAAMSAGHKGGGGQPAVEEAESLLPSELRWVTNLRWLAGLTIIAGGVGHALATASTLWSIEHGRVLATGAAVLLYNFVLWLQLRSAAKRCDTREQFHLAGLQIVMDLAALTLLALWTGGLASPLLGLFVLHMVLGSLVLPALTSYAVAWAAITMLLAALSVTSGLPWSEPHALLIGAGWGATLLLTVFLTTHIAGNLRRQEAARRRQHRQINAILDTAAEGIITIDSSGRIRSANPAAVRLFGYELSELLGRNVGMLMPQPYRSEHDEYIERYKRTGEARIIGIGREVTGQRKDGSIFPLDLAVSEVDLGKQRIFTGIVRDITERKNAEAELRAMNERLQRQQQAMVQHEKMAAMGQMAAGVAHEIANPLASLDSVLQLLQRQGDGGRISPDTVRTLREQVARINRIVREMTAFAHPRGADWQIRPLMDVIQGALQMARFDHRLRAIEVSCTTTANGASARLMPQALQQVLVNMILNAVDAVAEVPQPRIEIRLRRENDWHVIEIADNGHGIPAEQLGRIFEPFFTTKPVGHGTGLGLSVSYGLIQRHGGRCEVASMPGSGTTFTIYLPAKPGNGGGADAEGGTADLAALPQVEPGRSGVASCPREALTDAIPESGKSTS